MADQDQDNTEEATPFKLREAKRRGQVWKSMEINSAMLLSTALAITYWSGQEMAARVFNLARAIFAKSGQIELQPSQTLALFKSMVVSLAHTFWPLVVGLFLVGVLANVIQTGPVLTFFPLKPDFNRLNPAEGFKRLFSIKILFEAGKSLLKLSLFSVIIYFVIVGSLPAFLGLMDTDPKAYGHFFLDQTHTLGFKILSIVLVVALLDIIFTRRDFAKRMRMSRREIKDEVKRREGDPQIRAKRRELQREAARRASSIRRVPDADVLITNPTRLAVALQYKRGEMIAPHIIAKGAGDLAAKMREVAKKHEIPIVENKPLARILFKTSNLDHPVGEAEFPAVAKVLAWVYSMQRLKRESRAGV